MIFESNSGKSGVSIATHPYFTILRTKANLDMYRRFLRGTQCYFEGYYSTMPSSIKRHSYNRAVHQLTAEEFLLNILSEDSFRWIITNRRTMVEWLTIKTAKMP